MTGRILLVFAGALMSAVVMTMPADAAGKATYEQTVHLRRGAGAYRTAICDAAQGGPAHRECHNGMLSSLDPHSSYMNAKDAEMRAPSCVVSSAASASR
ncbi:hypothetical protein DdX_21508 [Ditylenchus destructor]|uniref:Uncharacterized protein n=1 Tax=Ditylenchus destructor TaxID=166010 RepID=A0AAD4QV78_9BILA|nr:hypothetical protein DdX_21508 [Ditylenchus destructor]